MTQGLSFDWDGVLRGEPLVEDALNSLAEDFGWTRVFYRTSSSGTGLHILIAELSLDMNLEQSLHPISFPKKPLWITESGSLNHRGILSVVGDSFRTPQEVKPE